MLFSGTINGPLQAEISFTRANDGTGILSFDTFIRGEQVGWNALFLSVALRDLLEAGVPRAERDMARERLIGDLIAARVHLTDQFTDALFNG